MIPKGYRLVMRHVKPGEEYVEPSSLSIQNPHGISMSRWHLSSPSTFELPVLERVKPQLLVLCWEIREGPVDSINVITPELAKALLAIGHTGKIVEAP